MADGSESNRWWENYLVRYFLPSLAGMLIILWLQSSSGAVLYIPHLLPDKWNDFNTGYLIYWLLLGSLYCYVASYPALVFHATRVLDYEDALGHFVGGVYRLLNPYMCTVLFSVGAAICAYENAKIGATVLVAVFAAIQIARILIVAFTFGDFGLRKDVNATFSANIAYAYLRKLSERRGVTTRDKIEPEEKDKASEKLKERIVIRKDEKDLVDSYRHLREHGNTALIVLLELALCPILYLCLEGQGQRTNKIWFVAVLTAWILPSVMIHGLAQQLERRFSRFKYSFSRRGPITPHEDNED